MSPTIRAIGKPSPGFDHSAGDKPPGSLAYQASLPLFHRPVGDFTHIDVSAINKEAGCISDAKVIAARDAPSRARKIVRKGDVLYSCVRPYLLNIAIVEDEITPPPIASTAFAILNGFGLVSPKCLWIVLRSPFMIECVEAKMRGQAYPALRR